MRLRLLWLPALVLVSLMASLAVADELEWIREDHAGALAKAQAENKIVLVDIWATWCGWCTKLDEEVFTSPEFAEASEDFVLLKIDSDANEGYLDKTGQTGLPTTAFFLPDGRLLAAQAGYMPTPAYVEMLGKAKGLRDKLDADVDAMTVDEALEAASNWLAFSNQEQASRIYASLENRGGLSAEQLTAIDMSLIGAALNGNDFAKATEVLNKRLAPGVTLSEFAMADPEMFKRGLRAIALLWLDVMSGGSLVSFEFQGMKGSCSVPAEPAAQAEFFAKVKGLMNLREPWSLTPEAALEAGRTLCQLLLPEQALAYLEKAGAAGAGDRVGALAFLGRYDEAIALANEVNGDANAPVAVKARALAGAAVAYAAQGQADTAKPIRDELLALEGLDERESQVWTNFLSDQWLARF